MKKKLAFCLLLLLAATLLTACGGDDTTTTVTTTTTPTVTTTAKVTTTEPPRGFDNFVIMQGARIEILEDAYLKTLSPAWSKRVCKALERAQVQTLQSMLAEKTWTDTARETEGYDVVFDLFTEETTNLYWYYVDFESKTVLRIAPLDSTGAKDGKSSLSDADLQALVGLLSPLFGQA